MKQGKPLIAFTILAIAAVITLYFVHYIRNVMDEPYRTTRVYAYTAHDSVTAEGLVVHQALVLPAQDGILEITRAEGEKVGKGQQIALVYRDSQAQSDQAAIESLDLEIDLLEEAIAQSGSRESAPRLDEEILQAVVALRASYALGDCTQLRQQVLDVKSSVLKRGYTYGEGLTSADLSARLKDLKGQRGVLNRQSARATTRVTAPVPGVFSSLVDGLENQITPGNLHTLTPSALQALIDSPPGEEGGAIGRLLTDYTWYLAANLPQEAAARLKEGGSATLRFSGELNRDVEMSVDQVGPSEGDKTLVIFSTTRYLTLTSLLRRQTVELIFDSWSGLRIPKAALHLEQAEPDSSASAPPANRTVVYALINGRTESREVSIVHEGADYYVVRPVGAGRKVLRDGDTIITEGTGLQDGLLLEW